MSSQLKHHGSLACALLVGVFAAFGGAFSASAQQQSPQQLVEQTVQAAFQVLRNPKLRSDSKLRMQELRRVVDRAFDWEAMARSSLGAPWRQLDPAQRSEFIAVFKELLAERYMDDIDRFQGSEQIVIKGSSRSGELAVVNTVLITSSREHVPMDYTLHPAGTTWQVEDVSIEQVSMVNHYRKTFARFLANHSFSELLEQLTRRQKSPAAAALPK
ncbi:MAG TPA: ABC transporter substrate-binding protein [Polyangiales bacterium]|nr:ABC transporter substrate-binding protein [Polyangiales bacterium]